MKVPQGRSMLITSVANLILLYFKEFQTYKHHGSFTNYIPHTLRTPYAVPKEAMHLGERLKMKISSMFFYFENEPSQS